jgi:uncharacterized protein (TIGR03435 family)
MNQDRSLGEFEQIVLLAVLRLGDQAYGVTILAEIASKTGRNPSPGALYTTLHRMEDKGLITFRDGSPTPERGGRAKRFVQVTREGRNALACAQSAYRSLLEGLDLLTAPIANLIHPRTRAPHVSPFLTIFIALVFGGLPTRISYGQTKSAPAASPSDSVTRPVQFDVVSVKIRNPDTQESRMQLLPDGVRLSNLPLQDLIVQAYGLVLNDQIVGLPKWANSERFDIEAKVASGHIAAFRRLSLDQVRSMGRPILTDRFKFAGHEEKRVLPLYALVVAKDGSKLKPSTLSAQDGDGGGVARAGVIQMHHASNANGATPSLNELTARGVTLDRLASALSQQGLGRVVLDNTGLTDRYDFKLTWASDSVAADTNSTDSSGPSIFTAVSEQLGLKLEPQKGPVPVLVIDHIESPSLN